MGRVLLALVSTLFLVMSVTAGTWTSNNFLYKPATGARGDEEKAKFDSGLNRVDSRLANEKWLNDPLYSGDLATAISTIGSAKAVLSIPAGNWPIAANLTVPATLTLKFVHGAVFTIATGKTLTINGPLDAGRYQIFSCVGTGKVVFAAGAVKETSPEWWGAYSDGTNAAATYAAIQAAFASGYNPVSLLAANGNYNIGTSQLVITNLTSQHFKMAVGSRITYSGADAAIKVYVGGGAGSIWGLILDLFDIYSTGPYCVKVVGDGTTTGPNASISRATIKAHQFFNFTVAGFYAGLCGFNENTLDIQNMQTGNYTTGYGYFFDDTDYIAKNYQQEANKIKTITVNARRALYAPGDFTLNNVDIGMDLGSQTPDRAFTPYLIGGNANYIVANVVNPVQDTFNTMHLLPTAIGNTIIASPWFFSGLTDESPVGSNTFIAPKVTVNLLQNPSFEWWNGTYSPKCWETAFNGTRTQETSDVRHGKSCLKFVSSGGGLASTSQNLPTSVIGQTVTISGWLKASATNTQSPALYLSSSAGSSGVSVPKDGRWHFLAINYSFPGGSTTPQVIIYADGGAGVTGQQVLVDGLVAIVGTSPLMPGEDQDHLNLMGQVTWDPNNISDNAMTSTTVGCIGAAVGDPVSVGFSNAVPAGAILSGSVTAADTVTVTLLNKTGGGLDLASGTLTVSVRK